ncbi:MAG: hypothetical protein ABIF71_04300 [Planctomycetota bacterium]
MKRDDPLFTLEVFIVDGPLSAKFIKKNKVVCRTIQIRGDQTLEDLHNAIFDAFDREEEHMYEFQVGGKGPWDPDAKEFGVSRDDGSIIVQGCGGNQQAGTVNETIGSLWLKKGDAFGYRFDFGDDWRHQINVVDIGEPTGRGKYPKVIKRVGQSPPQYMEEE